MKNLIEKISSPKVDKELLEQFAQEASSLYLNDGVPLEDTIMKIASRKDLNPHQIQRVCEFANLQTFQSLYKTSEDKTFEFDVADSKKIIREVNSPRVTYVEPKSSPMEKAASIDVLDILFPEIELSKTASEVKDPKTVEGVPYNDVRKAHQKITLSRDQSMDKLNMAKMSRDEFESEVHHIVKQSLLNGDLTESEIMAAALQRFPEQRDRVREIIMRVLKKLKAKNVTPVDETIKIASVPEKLLINDNHPLIRSIDSILESDQIISKVESDLEKVAEISKYIDKKLK